MGSSVHCDTRKQAAHEREPPLSNASIGYCTIVASNYLPQALALFQSVQLQEPGRPFTLLVIDADWRELESKSPGLTVVGREYLDLTTRQWDELATIYDVVELSTAVKPRLLSKLLVDMERVAYLDPDMWVVSPLRELPELLDEHGLVLTPHFLEPIPPDSAVISEVHSLTVGVHNLGFCAVSRSQQEFLDWWWSHLKRECLIYPLLGLFVDQKWTDIGANLFHAHSLQHYGYNIGPWNLHERQITQDQTGYHVGTSADSLRLLHFSGFDPADPEAISERLNQDLRSIGGRTPAFAELSQLYAGYVQGAQADLGPLPTYGYARDSSGKALSKRLRRTYRAALLHEGPPPPSAFASEERAEFATWRRRSFKSRAAITASDLALAAKYALPDEFAAFKKRAPDDFKRLRSRLLGAGKVRR